MNLLNTTLPSSNWALTAVLFVLLVTGGCSSLQSLGIPVATPQHRLMRTTRHLARANDQAAPIPKELVKGVLAEYRVEPGDILFVDSEDLESSVRLPGEQTVAPDGKISLGIYGRLAVAGASLSEIRLAVQERVKQRDDTLDASKINVRIVNWESKVFYVLGEVNSPGAYQLVGNETVLDAIIKAGDLTRSANQQQIILVRPSLPEECRIVLPVCYRHIVQLGDTSTNYQIQPGDRVFIASTGWFDDLLQTFRPFRGEICPACSSCQQSCDPSATASQIIPSYSSLAPAANTRMLTPK